MKFQYHCYVSKSGSKFIHVKLNENQNFTSVLRQALKSINPVDEILTPFEERFNDEWEFGIQSTIGYFKVKIESPYNDVWINGTNDCITAIDLLLQDDERFERVW